MTPAPPAQSRRRCDGARTSCRGRSIVALGRSAQMPAMQATCGADHFARTCPLAMQTGRIRQEAPAMFIATNRDAAEAFREDRSNAGVRTPLSVQLRRWLTEAWARREQRLIARLVSQVGHPGA